MKRVLIVLLSVLMISSIFAVENTDSKESRWYGKVSIGYYNGSEKCGVDDISFNIYNLDSFYNDINSANGFTLNPGFGFIPVVWRNEKHVEKLLLELDVPTVYGEYSSRDEYENDYDVSGKIIRFAPSFSVNCSITFPQSDSAFLKKFGIVFGAGITIPMYMLNGAKGSVTNGNSTYISFDRSEFTSDLLNGFHFVINVDIQYNITEKFSALIEFKKYLISTDSSADPGLYIGAGIKRQF